MKIRNVMEKDLPALEHVCLETASGFWKSDEEMVEAVLEVFCRYYFEKEREHCFVTVNEDDEAIGYILCAPDYERYYKLFMERINASKYEKVRQIGKQAADEPREFAADYPAHLHIDLLPETQGKGCGRALVETLCAHLREIGVKGVMLDVGADNTGAIAFYNKCGFKVLKKGEGGQMMGREIL